MQQTLSKPSESIQQPAITIIRSKSAVPPLKLTSHVSSVQRPRTVLNTHREINITSHQKLPLATVTDNLNLKTFKDVDRISDVITSGYRSLVPLDKARERQKDEIYKKFWHLKSTGQYHGSLLAKPKVMAPEIRE